MRLIRSVGRHGNARVVIIEDDEPVAQVLRAVVVDLVGERAVAIASPADIRPACAPDLVITDLVGPGADLPGTARAYLASVRERFGETPVMVVSAQQWIRNDAHRLPVDDVVLKPFDIDDLAARIRALLDRARRPAA